MYRLTRVVATVAALGVAFTFADAALARSKKYEDAQRGFSVSLDDDLNQVPPKLTDDNKYLVGEWYVDAAKYAGGAKPTFEIVWFPTVKKGPVTPTSSSGDPDTPGDGGAPPSIDLSQAGDMEEMYGAPKSVDQYVERMLRYNENLFGKFEKLEARRAADPKALQTIKTAGKDECEVFEINSKKAKKGEPEPKGYLMVARLQLDRPADKVEVGFVGYCPFDEMKSWSKKFVSIVKSFKALDEAENTRNLGTKDIDTLTPEEFRDYVKKQKVADGWKAKDTKNYLILYNDNVKTKLVNEVASRIEAIREQLYETIFPPDKPVTAVSVVRLCKDADEYHAYGGPGGSAGYWASSEKELVFYEDDSKKDTYSVLYHEAFHQYIYYSVGDLAPHSWFNEGHGDFFAGYDYKGGKFIPKEFDWRRDLAKETKRTGKAPPLKEWLTWSQGKYYGSNEYGLGGGENYALGWSFIWFLRNTRNKEYQQILPRYFDSLKTSVTNYRKEMEKRKAEREERLKRAREGGGEDGGAADGGDGEDGADGADGTDGADGDDPSLEDLMEMAGQGMWAKNDEFLKKALDDGFKGIDMAKLEKDWLDD